MPANPKEFRDVSTDAMEAAVARAASRLDSGDDRRSVLIELYNWGWIHEWRSQLDHQTEVFRRLISESREISSRFDAATAKFKRLAGGGS